MFRAFALSVSLALAVLLTASSVKSTKYVLHRNRRQTSQGVFCPRPSFSNVKVKCIFQEKEVPCDRQMEPGTIAMPTCKHNYKPAFKPRNTEYKCLSNGNWDQPFLQCIPECGSSNEVDPNRIIDGKNASVGAFPWHAGLYFRQEVRGQESWEQRCSGSLISNLVILTAAHCVINKEERDVRVALGKFYRSWSKYEPTQEKRNVEKIIVQRDFSEKTYTFDIALVVMDKEVKFGDFIMPVCHGFLGGSTFITDKKLYVVGWGLTKAEDRTSASDTLLYNDVLLVPANTCKIKAPSVYPTFDKFCAIKNNQTKVSIVQPGDSGGGQTALYEGLHYIFGIVSTKSDEYSMFTNITWPYNMIWVENQMKKYNSNFKWVENEITNFNNNNRGCVLPQASLSRRYCSMDDGCEDCSLQDRRCFIHSGTKVEGVRVVCAPGYTLQSPYRGADVATCVSGQSWYPGVPECVRYQYLPGEPWIKVTWQEARDSCLARGAQLATIKDAYQQEKFEEAVKKQFDTTGGTPSSIWIGLHDLRFEGTFEWVDGSVLGGNDFAKWLPDEPSNSDNLEHCVQADAGCDLTAYRSTNNSYHWNDNYCTELNYYFCKEIALSNSPLQALPVSDTIGNHIGNKVRQRKTRKYLPGYPWAKVTWEQAKANCYSRGDHLAIIRSQQEQKLFEEAAAKQFNDTGTEPDSIWIGLSAANIKGKRLFEWEDGSLHSPWRTCVFSNWLPKQPYNYGGKEDCVEAAAGSFLLEPFNVNGTIYQWNDSQCELEKYYFCSVKL